ncbi:MAG: glycyl-tRNA synthetase beta chain, partial [Thermodesulfobacteriota bacterium]|nr:glycyl-tRNA synthetase beta chain [Thermodesulfobacteriota bacterium]
MRGEFLLEIGIEEIPASYIKPALRSLSEIFSRFLENSLISHGPIETFATPRRLIMTILDVAPASDSRTIEKTGPPVTSAYDHLGVPTKAAEGFARSQGVSVKEQLVCPVVFAQLQPPHPLESVFSTVDRKSTR